MAKADKFLGASTVVSVLPRWLVRRLYDEQVELLVAFDPEPGSDDFGL